MERYQIDLQHQERNGAASLRAGIFLLVLLLFAPPIGAATDNWTEDLVSDGTAAVRSRISTRMNEKGKEVQLI